MEENEGQALSFLCNSILLNFEDALKFKWQLTYRAHFLIRGDSLLCVFRQLHSSPVGAFGAFAEGSTVILPVCVHLSALALPTGFIAAHFSFCCVLG